MLTMGSLIKRLHWHSSEMVEISYNSRLGGEDPGAF